MAKKKGKKGKGKKVKGARSEKAILKSEIKKLEADFQKYEALKTSLEEQRKETQILYETEVQDKEAIVQHLQRQLMKEAMKAEGVKERLSTISSVYVPKKLSLEQKIVKLKDDFAEMKGSLTEKKNTVAGKLSMLEELRLQKDGIMMELEQAEKKVIDEKKMQILKLREVDKEHVLERQRLNMEYVRRVEELFNEFDASTAEELTDMIKKALRKYLDTNQQLEKVSSSALEVQAHHVHLKEQARLLKFETELGEEMEKSLSSKIQKQHKKMQSLMKKCEEQNHQLSVMDNRSWKTAVNRLKSLKSELLKLQAKWQDLKSQKDEQERYLKITEEIATNLQKENAQLTLTIETAEKIIRKEIASKPNESGVRNKLLEQFVNLMNLRSTAEK